MTSHREYFRFRLSSRKIRDRNLSKWIAQDLEAGELNLSEVIKDLLYSWYMQRKKEKAMPANETSSPPIPEEDDREDPNDPLVRNLVNMNFDNI